MNAASDADRVFTGAQPDLAANAKVRVGDELGLLVAVALLLQEGVQHAHGYTGQSDHKAQDLPCLGCRKRNKTAKKRNVKGSEYPLNVSSLPKMLQPEFSLHGLL